MVPPGVVTLRAQSVDDVLNGDLKALEFFGVRFDADFVVPQSIELDSCDRRRGFYFAFEEFRRLPQGRFVDVA